MKIDRRKGSWLFYTIRMISRKCMTNIRKLALLFKMPILAVMTSNCQGVSGVGQPSLSARGWKSQ
jgi:hypothetical protein